MTTDNSICLHATCIKCGVAFADHTDEHRFVLPGTEDPAPTSDTQTAMEMAIKANARLRLSVCVRLTAWAFVTGNKETSWEAYIDIGENKDAKILTAPTFGQLAPLLEEYEP